ncbi:aminotransferase class IV [Bacteriovoracaceae bacterium]|nr:aminotransferase class IV [Bacteriovoracaceae bacterium]
MNYASDFDPSNLLISSKWLLGESFFTSFRSNSLKVVGFDEHMARLRFSLKSFYQLDDLDLVDLREFLEQSLPKSEDIKVRIEFFRPNIENWPKILSNLSCLVQISEYKKCSEVRLSAEVFKAEYCEISKIKSSNYMRATFLKNQLQSDYLIKEDSKVVDASSSSFIILKNTRILVPILGSGLESITLKLLIKSFNDHQINFMMSEISENDLSDSSEIILLNSVRGVIACTHFGDKKLLDWQKKDSLTSQCKKLYEDLFRELK